MCCSCPGSRGQSWFSRQDDAQVDIPTSLASFHNRFSCGERNVTKMALCASLPCWHLRCAPVPCVSPIARAVPCSVLALPCLGAQGDSRARLCAGTLQLGVFCPG